MAISLRDHKMLWGRAGALCSICRIPLATIDEIGRGSLIGEEAHIVARSVDGPRGESALTLEQRDSYSNLVLLCPTHHAIIDDRPRGPIEYPVDRLRDIKATHEAWAASLTSFNRAQQLADEQWAAIIDSLDHLMVWDTWTTDMSFLFSFVQTMRETVFERLRESSMFILSRVWPPGHEYLRQTIEVMRRVLDDLLDVFELHLELPPQEEGVMRVSKFYKIPYWSEKDYRRLTLEWEYHTGLIEDLAFELTRYGNLFADIVRAEIDPSYRFEEGVLVIRDGIDILWKDTPRRPQFTPEEIDGRQQPYVSLDNFISVRSTREISVFKNGTSRGSVGYQATSPPADRNS